MKYSNPLAPGQKENAKHGEVLFPVQKYITKLTSEYPVMTTHWHEEAEFTVITKGTGIYQIDLTEYEVKEGDIIFIPPLLLHAASLDNRSPKLHSETYVFHMSFLGGNAADICSTRYLTPLINHDFSMPCLITAPHPAYMPLFKCFRQIALLYKEQEFGYELALKSLLLQSVFLLLPYSDRTPSAGSNPSSDKLKIVLDYVSIHYADTILVSDLAGLCYFSEYHFMRFFKKHMHMTCMQYINNVRLEKSVEQFEHGNTSILDVSLSVGFHNLSYFHRAFKKKYHMTPRSFIQKLEQFQ